MNTSTFWIIILGFWIFILQSRVKHLEKMVESIKNKIDTSVGERKPSAKKQPIQENLQKKRTSDKTVYDEENGIYVKASTLSIQEPKSSVKILDDKSEEKTEKRSDERVAKYVTKPSKTQKLSKPMTRVHKAQSAEPKEPSVVIDFITNYFTGGNLLVRIGSVILFFDLAFLVKYAAVHTSISIETRLWLIAMVSLVLVVMGWRLRDREGAYGQVLQGLGIAILYLLIYAASKYYTLLSPETAFMLMLGVVIVGSTLAVIEDALPLALFATAGGFLVPILTSTGEGSHVMLFSYYALLNLGVFTVAWYRSWRVLNIVGFVFTFIISATWGASRYTPELFSSTEPFLILYFLMYLSISILFTIKHPYEPKNLVDGTLVFGLPVVAFPLQVKLVTFFEYGEAYSAVALGLMYLLLSYVLKNKERTALLAQSFLALGIVFLTIAVPYIFDADVSAALWSLESAGIVWIALKQNKVYTCYFGQALLFVSIVVYTDSVKYSSITLAEYLGYLVLITAVFATSYLLNTHREKLFDFERLYTKILLLVAIGLWFVSTPNQLMKFDISHVDATLLSLIFFVPVFLVIIRYTKWQMLMETLQGYFPLGAVFIAVSLTYLSHPFEGLGAMTLSVFVLFHYVLLYAYDKVWSYTKPLHIATLWLMVIIGILELRYHADFLGASSASVAMATVLTPLLFALLLLIPKRYVGWLEAYRPSYQIVASAGLVVFLLLWTFKTFGVEALSSTAYIPLFNPLDLMQAVVLAVMYYWVAKNKTTFGKTSSMQFYVILAFVVTLFIAVIFARSVHMFRNVSYTLYSLWQDDYFQSGLSILWSIIAIVLMLLSKRYKSRPLWLAGFGLLILVVLKLFFVELASSGTVERIVSFMVVGTLLLVIGYFVPLPPSEDTKRSIDKK